MDGLGGGDWMSCYGLVYCDMNCFGGGDGMSCYRLNDGDMLNLSIGDGVYDGLVVDRCLSNYFIFDFCFDLGFDLGDRDCDMNWYSLGDMNWNGLGDMNWDSLGDNMVLDSGVGYDFFVDLY